MESLAFYSTNGQAPRVDLRTALLQGQAPDRGLYLPEKFPPLTTAEIAGQSYPDIAFAVLRRFTGGILDGVNMIFQKSDVLDKAAVVNISQGTHIGAHDNTSLLEQGVNNAVAGSAQAYKAESSIPSVTVVSRTDTYSHLDPLLASADQNDFLKTVVPWLKKIDSKV